MQKRIVYSVALLFLIFALVSCDFDSFFLNSGNEETETTSTEQESTETVDTISENDTELIEYSIVGTWHYSKNDKDAYIRFDSDGSGIIHYYQYYGSGGGNLNTYVNWDFVWSRNPNSDAISINVHHEGSCGYVISELTSTTLIITNNGAHNSAVPISKTLTRE